MVQRLFIVLGVLAATLAVPGPAHAATLTVTDVMCYNLGSEGSGGGRYGCDPFVTGGTGTYTSFVWGVRTASNPTYYFTTYGNLFGTCVPGRNYTITVTVTDSAGATASNFTAFQCRWGAD
ncbi:MAG: hypothetical protein JOZ51_26345 [Chloroflexi bacterium]|nr:hypothetical protein [Chloroflexota bacterium]